MNETIKFKKPIPFFQIRRAIKYVVDEYLPSSNLDDFSKILWEYNMKEFYKDSAFSTVSLDLKRIVRNRKFRLFRDYDYSDLGNRDFVLIDTGIPGRILLCDDGLYESYVSRQFSKDDLFTGIQFRISDSYDFTEEDKKEWFERLRGIVVFILSKLD